MLRITIYKMITILIISISLVLFFLFYIFSKTFLKNINQPIDNLVAGMEEMVSGNMEVQVKLTGALELEKMILSFNHMVHRINLLIKSNEQKEDEKRREEIRALQSQINPHFLVNTLGTIRFMAQAVNHDGIRNMAESLMRILSCSFKSKSSFYTVEEEIDMLKSYIYIMRIRYADNFQVLFEVEEKCKQYEVPRLIIQPFLENAIIHGFEDGEEPGLVQIKVYEKENILYFSIEDNGKGISKECIINSNAKDGHGIGIENVNKRIQLNYGDSYGVEIESKVNEYTKVVIKIPAIIYQGE